MAAGKMSTVNVPRALSKRIADFTFEKKKSSWHLFMSKKTQLAWKLLANG